MVTFDWETYAPYMIGFDNEINRINRLSAFASGGTNYPPYNIITGSDNRTILEVALAGFDESEIEVSVKDDTLTIESKKDHSASGGGDQFLHQGIAERNFKRTWTLSPTVKVAGASFVNGFLSVNLVNEIPEEKKARVIELNGDAVSGDPSFLSE